MKKIEANESKGQQWLIHNAMPDLLETIFSKGIDKNRLGCKKEFEDCSLKQFRSRQIVYAKGFYLRG